MTRHQLGAKRGFGFAQFGFAYEPVFQCNGDNLMESNLKEIFEPNFKSCFYQAKTKVATVKQYLGMRDSTNPGPTEWRVMARPLVDAIRGMANLDGFSAHYADVLAAVYKNDLDYAVDELTLCVGDDYEVSNKQAMTVPNL